MATYNELEKFACETYYKQPPAPREQRKSGDMVVQWDRHIHSCLLNWGQGFASDIGWGVSLNITQAGNCIDLSMSSSEVEPFGVIERWPTVTMPIQDTPVETIKDIITAFFAAKEIDQLEPSVLLAPLGYKAPVAAVSASLGSASTTTGLPAMGTNGQSLANP